MKTPFTLALLLSLLPMAALAQLQFSLPVDCAIGTECFVQNYVDHDAEKGDDSYHDFTCGRLSYDSHTGTDFRLRNLAQMGAGVKVLAAADGKVVGVRSGVPDTGIPEEGSAESIKGKECGNGVMLNHAIGWNTQYCHLKNGSIRVQKGQQVKRGDVLGEIGLSGQTAFPHMHFGVYHHEKVVDPFIGHGGVYSCGAPNDRTLWDSATLELLTYRPSGVLGFGFTDHKPTETEVRSGLLKDSDMTAEDAAMVVWVDVFGIQKGEKLTLNLRGPDGSLLVTNGMVFDRSKALVYFVAGKINRALPWASGDYTAELIVATPEADGSFKPRINETRILTLGTSGDYISE